MTTEIDTEAIHAKYLAERDKRLRPDGNDQYIEPTGKFANYLEDPYTPPFERQPLFDEVTVAFIGGGFAGLVTGARLKQAGIDDVRIIEKGGDFGGTWYWNRYPGAQCDTAAFVYMPLLEETGHMPTEKYTHAPEILDHCRRIANHFDLYDNACLSTEVTGLEWDQESCRWIIRTNRGDEMRAKFVAMGTGPLHRPKLPGIAGIESFEGPDPEFTPEAFLRAYHDSDDEKMVQIRERVDEIIDDTATAEVLKPWFRQLCKRPCFHDEYLQSYNNPNTHLIDTDGKGVARIDETGVWANGEHYELDCVIYASGFEVGTEYARRSGYDTVGRDGVKLSERWADGMQTLHGMHVHGFPNVFVVQPTHAANLISNIPHNLVEAGSTIAKIIGHAIEVDAQEVEVAPQAEQAWMERLERGGRTFGANPECTPGYYNNEGQPAGRAGLLNRLGYPGGPVAYFEYIDAWRNSGDFEGLTFR